MTKMEEIIVDWLELTIRYLGIGLLTAILLAVTVGALLCFAIVVVKFTPRLHVGKPTNEGELCFYDSRHILTLKNNEHCGTQERRLVNRPLKFKWWFGLSHRGSPKWFIGIIRWEPAA